MVIGGAAVRVGKDGLPYVIRAYGDADQNLILNSWICSYQHFVRGHTRRRLQLDLLEERIKNSLAGPGRAAVACSRQDPARIFGWAVAEGAVLHYVFVKRMMRHQGLAHALVRELVPAGVIHVSHWTLEEMPDGRDFLYIGFP